MALSACEQEAADTTKKKSIVNPEVYQAFFAHYPFGGHPVQAWADQLNALAPGGSDAHPSAYALARRRAERAGLIISGAGQSHEVRIQSALLTRLIDRVDQDKDRP